MALHPTLRITKWTISSDDVISNTDFSIFLKKSSPVYTKGRKVSSDYLDPADDSLVARKTYTDTLDVNGRLAGVDTLIEWFDGSDTALLSKTKSKIYNISEVESEIRSRRFRAMDYLKAAGKGTPVEPYQNAIFAHYETETRFWYDMGGTGIADAIAAETDANILTYLAIETSPGWTVQAGILYQIDHPWDV
jgi:hypothetical protein